MLSRHFKTSAVPLSLLVYNLASLSHVCHVEKGRAWVSDPAAARSENVALPFLFAWFALFDAKKVTHSCSCSGGVVFARKALGESPVLFLKRREK